MTRSPAELPRQRLRLVATGPDAERHVPMRRELRDVCGLFTTGVTVVTVGGAQPHGMTANSFTSVSLTPPLVLVCVDRDAVARQLLLAEGLFAVSVLAAEQEPLARHFADRSRPRGRAQFSGTAHTPGRRTGAPLLAGALGWLECSVRDVHDGGDHSIVVGDVLDAARSPRRDPLLFFAGQFRTVGHEPAPDVDDGPPLPPVAVLTRHAAEDRRRRTGRAGLAPDAAHPRVPGTGPSTAGDDRGS